MTRVLYLSGATGADYQCDMLFHGLRSLLGPDCVDFNKLTFMYQGEPYPPFYTVYALLPDIEVDREDISGKLEARYFDVVIYGSIQRFRDHFDGVQRLYRRNEILFIDGEDDQTILPITDKGIYFKRELADGVNGVLPIEFCIPKEKIRDLSLGKIRMMSPLIPGDYSTYIYYGSESKYYDQYGESYFAHTKRKGGWDCCRHYEIMAAGCLPYFDGLEECPKRTLNWLDKNDLWLARYLCDHWQDNYTVDMDNWNLLMRKVQANLVTNLTTEAMAKYVLDKVLHERA